MAWVHPPAYGVITLRGNYSFSGFQVPRYNSISYDPGRGVQSYDITDHGTYLVAKLVNVYPGISAPQLW